MNNSFAGILLRNPRGLAWPRPGHLGTAPPFGPPQQTHGMVGYTNFPLRNGPIISPPLRKETPPRAKSDFAPPKKPEEGIAWYLPGDRVIAGIRSSVVRNGVRFQPSTGDRHLYRKRRVRMDILKRIAEAHAEHQASARHARAGRFVESAQHLSQAAGT